MQAICSRGPLLGALILCSVTGIILSQEHGAIRLANGNATAGRVEIYLNGEWGTVCDDYWGIADADVACRQLGFTRALHARVNSFFGHGQGPTQMDDVGCSGMEEKLINCTHIGSSRENCDHSEDAGVVCFISPVECPSPCLNGGTCAYNDANEAVCLCPEEYTGETCQYRDTCLIFSFCENNATCVQEGNRYSCQCPVGFGGARCEYPDACISSPCPEHRRCENVWPDSYKCTCGEGRYGPGCNLYNACHATPCQNGGRCLHQDSGNYTCECDSTRTGYHGEHCEDYDICLIGDCDKTTSRCEADPTSEMGYRCLCYPGFYGADCSSYNQCLLKPCNNNATCEPIEPSASYICHCAPGYSGKMCDEAATCPSDTTVSLKGIIEWPATPIDQDVTLPCPTGGGTTTRKCLLEGDHPKWTFPNSSQCLDTELDPEVAGVFTSQLASTTEGAADMEESELESAVELLSAVVEFTYSNLTIAKDMIRCVSNVLDVDAEVMASSSSEGKDTSGEILFLIKEYGENAVLGNTSFLEFREANMQLHIVEPDPVEVTDGLEFEEDVENATSMRISLPAELFSQSKKTRVRFTALQNGKLFQEGKNMSGQASNDDPDKLMVISAEVTGRTINGLQETVNYSLGVPQPGEKYICVFWDEKGGFWNSEGLQTLPMTDANATTIECSSSHLTYFAVLLDTGLGSTVPPEHKLSLTIISYVGSFISMAGLVVTFITYSIFRSLRKQPSGKLLVNLCASLFFLNLFFILDGTGTITGTEFGCKTAAMLLHYFVLSTFFWMGAEAVSIYRSLVEVFQGNRASYYVGKSAIFAWGGAVVPVAVVLVIDHTLYNRHPSADICLLSQDNRIVYYLLYLAPCTAVLLSNFVVFILVLRAVFACNKQVHHNSARLRRTQVGCALSITFLLGLTWLFGFFAISEVTLPAQYIFCILNSMQGFFIFLFRCALYPEAVRSWKMCWKMRTLSVDRHINSSALQKHSSHRHPESSSSSKKSTKSKQNTKVTFASGSDSSKRSFRWLRRNEVKSNKNDGIFEEKYKPTETNDLDKNKNFGPEYPFKIGFTDEDNV